MAPLVLGLTRDPRFVVSVVVTGQHRVMLDQVHEVFGIRPDTDLGIHRPGQTLTDITSATLAGVGAWLAAHRPDVVMVQGDTTSSFAAALAAFYARVPVVHAEAGLRTHDLDSPYPEEGNRQLTGRLAALHLAATPGNRENLLAEGVPGHRIVVTGNSVIDALHEALGRDRPWQDGRLATRLAVGRPVVLVTAHRRESWGEPLRAVGRAVGRLARRHPDHDFVLPVHANPDVRAALEPPLAGLDNVVLTEPAAYGDFCRLLRRARIVLSDSGGVQEEAPSLGTPVLVLREVTERPEAVAAGTVRIVGTDEDRIVREASRLLLDPAAREAMARSVNPYGDGRATERTVAAIAEFTGVGERLPDFTPAPHPPTERLVATPRPPTERLVPTPHPPTKRLVATPTGPSGDPVG